MKDSDQMFTSNIKTINRMLSVISSDVTEWGGAPVTHEACWEWYDDVSDRILIRSMLKI